MSAFLFCVIHDLRHFVFTLLLFSHRKRLPALSNTIKKSLYKKLNIIGRRKPPGSWQFICNWFSNNKIMISPLFWDCRLTPLYLIAVITTEIAFTYLVETSPFWLHDRCDKICPQNWWQNVLYIQNLFDVTEICANWTWSMACEMQFFIIVTALLFLYAKWVLFESPLKLIFDSWSLRYIQLL